MPDLLAAPALVKILGAFALVLAAARLKANLGVAMLLGALVLGLWFGMRLDAIGGSALASALAPRTWTLMLLVGLIVAFGKALQVTGRLDRIVRAVVARAGSRRRAAALLPALIGLLPMPGGAYLSAPLVDAAARADGLRPHRLAAINYWFRHLLEFWWPLYPGVIVAVDLLGKTHPGQVNLGWFILFQAPCTLAVLLGGRIFLLGPGYARERARNGREPEDVPAGPAGERLLPALSPLLLVVGLTLLWSVLGVAAQALELPFPRLRETIPLAAFVALGIGLVFRLDRPGRGAAARVFLQGKVAAMALIILGVMVFQDMIHDSGAVTRMGGELGRAGIPPLLLLAALPFVAGLVTGIAVGFVGAAFPVVAGLMPHEGGAALLASAYVLAYGAGWVGMILSPVHFCLILTREYFQASLRGFYGLLAGPALGFALVLAGLVAFYRLLG